ncbi:BREX-2 system adenine-specific DNA-methyltransferase PglX [Corallococcus sp. ZKHCc1 1396]|uniref:site-specific DNA-methyltransferase (adenine-specific) n=1 Tax=Corallococcus soli TaxID=2710757 RepID=A0ABR9PG75_9BACT|nr:BREX-2 system adenine-specific DNA-methyltransferase PglX [Corallococcus soli]MBE4746902.1 BREX-2 system adenine-specific DNA-methyltransferase PglX [Corallococcus soli]
MSIANLPKLLQPALKALEKDLLARAKTERVEAGLKAAWGDEQKAGQTGLGFEPWRRERVTQLAVSWILSIVFVRTLEDRGYVDPRVAGATASALRAAEDREALFLQVAPFLGPREYLLAVFRELAKLPGARDVFDTKHNPVWVLSPSSEGAQALLDFFRKPDASGAPALIFPKREPSEANKHSANEDTRFLGDLYQDLSEAVRKRYALLQTPEFVEEFILDQTLDPAIAEFGLKEVTLIDPTCGSGHFLLGAFRRLLGRWQKEAPTENIADLARRALDQVYGVDINPYAVAIARFRLVLALLDAVGIKRLERAPDIKPNVVVADSLLHRFDQRVLSVGQMSMDDDLRWGDRLFRLESRGDVERVLTKRFHAVLGNPPYITEKDGVKKRRFKELYDSITGRWALGAPFTQRFFDLAVSNGFVGLINTNAWTKRDYGKVLIEKVLPRFDVQKIIDTSGCYLPGHGTPTLLLFGRNRSPTETAIPAVLGKRGEQEPPFEPSRAPVWSEIVANHQAVGFDGQYVSVESFTRLEARRHPWLLAGGGARTLYERLEEAAPTSLGKIAKSVGVDTITRASDLLEITKAAYTRLGVEVESLLPYVNGDTVRDWAFRDAGIHIPVPYSRDSWDLWHNLQSAPGLARFLWPHRFWLANRFVSGGTRMTDVGLPHWAIPQLPIEKHQTPFSLVFGEVATHNHYVLDRGGRLFKQTAPLIKLNSDRNEADYQALCGYLNSSTVGFWDRLNFFQKGGDQVGEGARLSKTPWQDRLQRSGNILQQLPAPKLDGLREKLLELVVAAEEALLQMAELGPEKAVASTLAAVPKVTALRDVRAKSLAERARLRGILVSLQEEIDWRVYGLFGLPTVQAPSVDAVRVVVEPNQRPFEVRLAREVASDISASEWFRVHKREAPKDVGGPLTELYRQRLRLLDDPEHGKQLRLLETPETKRRWSPPDDTNSFATAVRMWLLDRIEASFREQTTPELRTARQLALELGSDPAVAAAHELLTEESGLDLPKVLSDLVDSDGVPFLACYRYAETGMEKRASWEEAWRLQRLEDEGKLKSELERLNLKAIPAPDNYSPKDYLRHYWSLRGTVDVPKERFVTVPGGNADEDMTPLVGWAGWDHLQVAQALSGIYQRRKSEDGWQKDRLVPLLAGLDERVPWLLQWHNETSAAFGGMKLGEFFRDFVAGEAHSLGVAVSDLRKWTPPAAVKRTTVDPSDVLAALKAWRPEVDEDEDADEEAEQPEGPTEAELASEVGATKALIKKALKKLEADGLVEKLSGRPARYLATGDEA